MRLTLSDILRRVGGYVDQDSSADPTGADLIDRINYSNRALGEWADAYDWDVLSIEHKPTTSAEQTSFGLPVTFRKPMSALYHYDATRPTEYPLIPREERFRIEPNAKEGYIEGSISSGFALIVPRGFSTGASLSMDIQVYPTSYATFADISAIPDAEYIVDRVISLVLEARSDSRFPLVKDNADRRLATMLEQQNAGNNGMNNEIGQDTSFVIGRD